MSRRRRVLHWSDDNDDDDDDDEFPDLANLAPNRKGVPKEPTVKTELQTEEKPKSGEKTTTIRRRKLGQLSDSNSLLQAWTPEETKEKELKVSSQKKKREEVTASQGLQKESSVRKDRVELRTRKTTPTTVSPPKPRDEDADEEYVSAQEEVEVTIIEDVSLIDDTFHSCESEDSEFGDLGGGSSVEEEDQDDYDDYDDDNDDDVDDDSDEDFQEDTPPRRPSSKSKIKVEDKDESRDKKKIGKKPSSLGGKQLSIPQLNPPASKNNSKKSNKSIEKEIANTLSKLRLDAMEFFDTDNDDLDATPPSTPPKPTTTSQRSLASPTKLPRIPATPHHVSSDSFWSKEFVDDWNDQHSPAKTLFPSSSSSTTTTTKSKSKSTKPPSPTTTTTKTTKPKPASSSSSQTLSKKAFSTSKQSLAESFLSELDDAITAGQLSAMSASTGGIRLIWTNKLSTTAGRANWKRTRSSALTHHHASIELSTKIISDPNRLLNVIAHEFCHLANFMVSGITTNPHGKEFKAWAAKVTAEFGRSRGIEVTTKHSYEIDFKYVWECDECATEFKRHSKSIDPARHRCGVCKGVLKQTKPAPRMTAKSGNDGEGGKVQVKMSEYQVFMKEKMKRVKEERPGLKQNEVMKIVAGRWKEMKEKRGNGGQEMKDEAVKEVEKGMEVIDLT